MKQKAAAARPRVISALPLYLAFAGTGIGVALPGALLPALAMRWNLGDERAGRLFLAAWIGSSIGALLVRGSLKALLCIGSLAIALGATAMGLTRGTGADAIMALFGLGLGMLMTSISLIRQQQCTAAGSGVEMVRLNLVWAAGACACPTLALHALAVGAVRPLLFTLGTLFALLAAWSVFQADMRVASGAASRGPLQLFRVTPAGLILMTLLVPGIEASAGAWLATYARRSDHTLAATIAAPTLFWAGLLSSRACWSAFPRWMTHDRVVRWMAAVMTVAAILLVATRMERVTLTAAFLLGFGIGPVYPLLLAWALRFQRGGVIFFLAGVSAACLPWLTGLISAREGSLHRGFLVPMFATLVLFALALWSPLAHWSRNDTGHG